MCDYVKVDIELTSFIQKTDMDGKVTHIPLDEANSDYQAYLEYVKDASK